MRYERGESPEEKLDHEYQYLRRMVDRVIKWGDNDTDIDELQARCIKFVKKAKKIRYHVVGMRTIESFINDPHRIPVYLFAKQTKGTSHFPTRPSSKNIQLGTPLENTPQQTGEIRSNSHNYSTSNLRETKNKSQPASSKIQKSPGRYRSPAEVLEKSTSSSQRRLPSHQSRADQKQPLPSPALVSKIMGSALKSSGQARTQSNFSPSSHNIRQTGNLYRAYLTAAPGTSTNDILRVVQQWIDEKQFNVSIFDNQTNIFEDGRGSAETTSVIENEKIYRLRVSEKNEQDVTYSSTILIGDIPDPWIWINIVNDNNQYVAVPRVAKYLLEKFDLFDADWAMQPEATRIGPEHVLNLVSMIRDRKRRIPLILAGSSDEPEMRDVFQQGLETWGNHVFGMGAVAILDPEATDRFNEIVGKSFAVSPWSLRTFLPEIELDDPSSARHHRFLGTRRLVEERPERVAFRLGNIVRSIAASTSVPSIVLDSVHKLEQESHRRLIHALDPSVRIDQSSLIRRSLAPTSAISTDPQIGEFHQLRIQVKMACEWLEIPSLDEDNILLVAEAVDYRKRNESVFLRVKDQLNKLESENASLRKDQSDMYEIFGLFEKDVANAEERSRSLDKQVVRLQNQVSRLQSSLARHEDPATVYGEEETSSEFPTPENMEDLLDKLVGLRAYGVYFTGDESVVEDLDRLDNTGSIVEVAWDCIVSCVDYLRAKAEGACRGNMHDYLHNPPSGFRTVAPAKHASRESDSTLNQYGNLRIFKVPADVDPTETILMQAHFKLPRAGMSSPRMHYYDDSNNSGGIYIGYIGPHLRIDGTN